MELFKIIGVALITAVTSILLKSTKPELSFAVGVAGVIVILIFIMDLLQSSINILATIASASGMKAGIMKILLKIVGVGYLTEFGAGILSDFGNNSLADKVVLGGKLTILVLSLPILESMLALVSKFLGLV